MAVKDKERYTKQMQLLEKKGYFMLESGLKSSDVREPNKDDLKPKRPANPAIYFVGSQIKKLMAEDNLKTTDAMKKAYECWAQMDEEAKQPFVDKLQGQK